MGAEASTFFAGATLRFLSIDCGRQPDIWLNVLAYQLGLFLFAGLIAIFGLGMTNVAGFYALQTSLGSVWAAVVVAIADFALAAIVILAARRRKPGAEIVLADDARKIAIDAVHGLVIGSEENALLSDHLRSLLPLLPTLPHAAGPRLARVLLELFTVTVPSLALPPSPVLSRKASQHEALAERAYAWIEQNLTADNLSPDAIAEALRVSRSRLYQVFMGFGGIAAYVLYRRLANVHDALRNPQDTRGIAELAHECGFQSEAHFSRAFKATYGLTPSEFRRRGIP